MKEVAILFLQKYYILHFLNDDTHKHLWKENIISYEKSIKGYILISRQINDKIIMH